MNLYYLAGLVIFLLILIGLLFVLWYYDLTEKPNDWSYWDYDDEVKRYKDIGKYTEYED